MSGKGSDTNDGEQGHGSEMEYSSQNNEHLRDKTGNNERRSDNDGTPPASHPLQLDEVSLNAIIAGVSAKLMSNPPVSGVMYSEPASQERQQQRQLVDTLTGELLVKLLIYNCYWHTRPAPPSGRVNLDRATPCIHTCLHTHVHAYIKPPTACACKSRTNYRLYYSWPTELYSGGH